MKTAERKNRRLFSEEEYNLDDEDAALVRRVFSKYTGRKVTGEFIFPASQGTARTVKVREVVRKSE